MSDNEWAMERLRGFISMSEPIYVPSPSGSVGFHSYDTPASESEVNAESVVVERLLDRHYPSWRADVPPNDEYERFRWKRHREASERCLALLENQSELEAHLGPAGPSLAASSLHPWVWESAAEKWDVGAYGDAVRAAARRVFNEGRKKLDRRDVNEAGFFQSAFSLNVPKADEPRLRLMDDDGSDTYKNLHIGAMNLGLGAYAAIRNVLSHEEDTLAEPGEQEALEYLAVFAVLARWIDAAKVTRSDQ